jgi:hypothetical protein
VVGPIRYGSLPNNFLDMTAFAAPCTFDPSIPDSGGSEANCVPGTRHFGNLRRNSLLGPNFKELNFSLFKNTALTEHVNLEIRAEFFNLLNHPNFASPILPGFIADAGTPNTDPTAGPLGHHLGSYALTTTGDVGIGNPFLGGGGPRGIQFAAKITF